MHITVTVRYNLLTTTAQYYHIVYAYCLQILLIPHDFTVMYELYSSHLNL